MRLRDDLTDIARRNGAKLKIVELPAGPPVLSTVVAAVYERPDQSYLDLIAASRIVKARMLREPGVVDVDDSVEEDQVKAAFAVDKEKAALNGITTRTSDELSERASKGHRWVLWRIPTRKIRSRSFYG